MESKNVKVKLFDIFWQTRGAGPSPAENLRTEIYFSGCKKAASGNPCPDCCNDMIWYDNKAKALTPEEIYDAIERKELPKYITLVGGEPTDQPEGLAELGKLFHTGGYHVILFTWHNMKWLKANFAAEVLTYFDIIITEPYVKEQRIYDYNLDDGIHNVIGSGNQNIYCKIAGKDFDILAGEVQEMTLDYDKRLKITTKDGKIYG